MPDFASPSYPPNNIRSLQYAAPTVGQTVTSDGSSILIIDPAGTLATLTIVLPASPINGQDFVIASSQIVTTLTVTGTIVGTLTALAVAGFARFIYSSTASKWFRAG